MSTWRALDEDDVKGAMSNTEVTQIRTALVSEYQSDPLAELMEAATAEMRGAIRANPHNKVDEDPTKLPPEAISYTAVMVRHRLLTRMDMEISDGRRTEYRSAERFMEQVRMGKFAVSRPDEAEDAQSTSPTPTVTGRTQQWTRTKQDGI